MEERSEGGGGNVRVNEKYTQQSTQESSKAKRKRRGGVGQGGHRERF